MTILTLTTGELLTCAILSAAVILFQLLTYHRSFEFAFDEEFARASGGGVTVFNMLSAVVVAVVIVISMRLVGTLLVSALLVFPVVSALRICRSYLAVTLCSAALAVSGALSGILVAVVAGTPVGATIVAVNMTIFLACFAIGRARK
jgi:zinc transport system permease protein